MPGYLGQGFAEKIGEIKELSPEDREVIAYGLEYFIHGFSGLILMLFLGWTLGLFVETLVLMFCWVMMRIFAGGAHCTALWRCTVVNSFSMLMVLLLTRGALNYLPPFLWVGVAAGWGFLAVLLWAPHNSERPILDPLRRRKLRSKAIGVVLLMGVTLGTAAFFAGNYWPALSVAGASGLAAGAFMISHPAFRLINFSDQLLLDLQSRFAKGGETQ